MMRKVTDKNGFGEPRKQFQTHNTDPSETVQSDIVLTDIATILKTYGQQGHDLLDATALEFADVSDFGDYHDVMMEVRRGEEAFLKLPAKVRLIFGNSVETWLDTAHDEDKRDELVAAGFLEPDKKDTVQGTGTGIAAASAEPGPPETAGSGEETGGAAPS